MLIIIYWLKTNGWYRNHSNNTLMKDGIFNSVAIRSLRIAFPNPYSCLIANNFTLIKFHLQLMKREYSQLVGKHRKQNEYIALTSSSNFAEFNACEEPTQKR